MTLSQAFYFPPFSSHYAIVSASEKCQKIDKRHSRAIVYARRKIITERAIALQETLPR